MFKLALPIFLGLVLTGDDTSPWAAKAISDWTEDDAKLILNDSPWAKTTQPSIQSSSADQNPHSGHGGGMGRGGIGFPGGGGGMGRHGGGYPGGGYPGGGYPGGGGGYPGGGGGYPGGGGGYPGGGNSGGQSGGHRRDPQESSTPQPLRLVWESAMPVRAAELKAHDTNAPTLDDDNHYAIAVYGVASRFVSGDPKSLSKQLKKDATLKREEQAEIKPSDVEIIERTDGPVIVYLFPRSKEISAKDQRIEFDAKIGKLQFTQVFFPDQMKYQGRLEL